jgi:signal peptidase II
MAPKLRLFLATFLVAYPVDQITKWLVTSRFYYGESVSVIPGFFDLTYVRNPGGAFSLFASGPAEIRMAFFIGTGIVAIVLLVVLYHRLESDALLAAAALGTILGGALGNLTDRIRVGEVVDFLDFHVAGYTWPTFNMADSCIVVGVAFLIFEIFMAGEEEPGAAPPPDEVGAESA